MWARRDGGKRLRSVRWTVSVWAGREPAAGGKVAKMATVGSKMATRLPSTGLKMPKMAT